MNAAEEIEAMEAAATAIPDDELACEIDFARSIIVESASAAVLVWFDVMCAEFDRRELPLPGGRGRYATRVIADGEEMDGFIYLDEARASLKTYARPDECEVFDRLTKEVVT